MTTAIKPYILGRRLGVDIEKLMVYNIGCPSNQKKEAKMAMMRKMMSGLVCALVLSGCTLQLERVTGPMKEFARATVRGVVVGVGEAVPIVTSPAAEHLGINISGNVLGVQNSTPLWGVLYSYCRVITVLEPGSIAFSKIYYFEPLNQQMPLAVAFYRDETFKEFVGWATTVMQYSSNYASPPWEVRTTDIVTDEGTTLQIGAHPTSYAESQAKEVDFGRVWSNNTLALMVVNGTAHYAPVNLSGKPRARVAPHSLYCGEIGPIIPSSSYGTTVFLSVEFEDPVPGTNYWGKVGALPVQSYRVPTGGIITQVVVIRPQDIQHN